MSKDKNTVLPRCNLLVIRSPDIDRAVTFYEAIGLTFTKHSHGSGPWHYTSEQCGFVFEIYPARDASEITAATRVGFAVDCVDSTVQRLVDLGATIRSRPSDSAWSRRAVMLDLDGYTVELVESIGGGVNTP